ncbi:hypothetical protein [Acinetobacter bereziniae]|uniref:hypothetical protein n=1 Tax=Acinetobacter bereziniae TaxID=106648 RepID=UPI00124C96C9|nr:hypothetical protein [Acinetobacter bereziniae]
MKYIFFLAILASLLIIILKPNISSKNKESKEFTRLGTVLTECQDLDPPKALDKKKYYDYCKCVKNPIDARNKEEKQKSCIENLTNPN